MKESKRFHQSSLWHKLKEEAQRRLHKKCSFCGGTANLEIHHKKHFSNEERAKSSLKDLVYLCRRCHVLYHRFVQDGAIFKDYYMARKYIKDIYHL